MLFIGSFVRWISLSTEKGIQGHPLAAEAATSKAGSRQYSASETPPAVKRTLGTGGDRFKPV
jgi:hypothetical protein